MEQTLKSSRGASINGVAKTDPSTSRPPAPANARRTGTLALAALGLLLHPGCTSPKRIEIPGGSLKAGEMVKVIGVKGLGGAIARYPASGARRGVQQHWTLASSFLSPGMGGKIRPGTVPPPAGKSAPIDRAAFEELLSSEVSERMAPGTLRMFRDGSEFFPHLSNSLRTTREPVDLQTYIFDTDDFAVSLADELKATSRRVPVRVVYDDLGSLLAGKTPPSTPLPAGFEPPKDMKKYLKEDSRIEVRRIHNVFLTSTHTKIITLGPNQAYIGGMNIGREYRSEWHDMMFEVKGPIVGLLQEEFEHTWERTRKSGDWGNLWPFSRRPEPRSKTQALPATADAFQMRVLRTRPFDFEIQKAIHLGIKHARQRIWIENPYFSDDSIVRELIEARHRGVDVRVILPEDADTKVMNESNAATASHMVKNGIRVYRYPGIIHVKAALYDGWALVGSANYDRLSLRLNEEVNIGYSDPKAVTRLEKVLFTRDFDLSREVSMDEANKVTAGLNEMAADTL